MNGLHSTGAEIYLFEVRMKDGDVLRYTSNDENVEWGGHTWARAPIMISGLRDQSSRELPGLSAQVSNVSREVQLYCEEHGGLVGAEAIIRIINSHTGAEVWTEDHFTILQSSVTAQWATFTLGAANPFRKRFPLQRVLNNRCRWRHDQTERCKYTRTCGHTLADCRAQPPCSANDDDEGRFYDGKARTIIYGGFPAAGRSGINA
jgi:lambda family phage minor tail protein L